MTGTYRCLRNNLWFRGMMLNLNDEITGEHPFCGKGRDLTEGDNPVFEVVNGPAKPIEKEPDDNDPRSDAEIRSDLWEIYGCKVHPNMKRSNLLSRELEQKMLHAKDEGLTQTAEKDYKVV